MKACLTCKQWESNYMTKYFMGHCKHDPNWTSRPHNGGCERHAEAENVPQRMEWLEKQGMK